MVHGPLSIFFFFLFLDQDGTLMRSFFDFLNSYIIPQQKPSPLKTGF